eukprot:maker-scaffold5_size1054832-snap-gene-8.9 protein:Tk04055 transcript:maker-scaffold5_size1054832-snap-gene-8.9-mRNA-1 annotation:"GI19951"
MARQVRVWLGICCALSAAAAQTTIVSRNDGVRTHFLIDPEKNPMSYASFIIAKHQKSRPKVLVEEQDKFAFPGDKYRIRVQGPSVQVYKRKTEDIQKAIDLNLVQPKRSEPYEIKPMVLNRFIGAVSVKVQDNERAIYVSDSYARKIYRYLIPYEGARNVTLEPLFKEGVEEDMPPAPSSLLDIISGNLSQDEAGFMIPDGFDLGEEFAEPVNQTAMAVLRTEIQRIDIEIQALEAKEESLEDQQDAMKDRIKDVDSMRHDVRRSDTMSDEDIQEMEASLMEAEHLLELKKGDLAHEEKQVKREVSFKKQLRKKIEERLDDLEDDLEDQVKAVEKLKKEMEKEMEKRQKEAEKEQEQRLKDAQKAAERRRKDEEKNQRRRKDQDEDRHQSFDDERTREEMIKEQIQREVERELKRRLQEIERAQRGQDGTHRTSKALRQSRADEGEDEDIPYSDDATPQPTTVADLSETVEETQSPLDSAQTEKEVEPSSTTTIPVVSSSASTTTTLPSTTAKQMPVQSNPEPEIGDPNAQFEFVTSTPPPTFDLPLEDPNHPFKILKVTTNGLLGAVVPHLNIADTTELVFGIDTRALAKVYFNVGFDSDEIFLDGDIRDVTSRNRYHRLKFGLNDMRHRTIFASVDVRGEMRPYPCQDYLFSYNPGTEKIDDYFYINQLRLRNANEIFCRPGGIGFCTRTEELYYVDEITKNVIRMEYSIEDGKLTYGNILTDLKEQGYREEGRPMGLTFDKYGMLWIGMADLGKMPPCLLFSWVLKLHSSL